MARPTGRYFASVIAKISEDKKNENILIDEAFRLRLRNDLMIRIAEQPQASQSNWFEIFMARLSPFKNYFAALPALVLVIVAASALSRSPLQFGSKQVDAGNAVPVAVVAPATPAPAPVVTMTEDSPQTFSGTAPAAAPAPVPVTSITQNTQPVVQETGVSQPVQSSPNTSSSGVFIPSFSPQPQFVPQPPVAQPMQIAQPMIQPSQMIQPVQSEPSPMSQPEVQSAPANVVLPPAPVVPASVVPATRTVRTVVPAAPAQENLNLSEMATLPAQNLQQNVEYQGSFSGDEQTVLENSILPKLVEGKKVNDINVSQNDSASAVVIQLQYDNGQTGTYNYQFSDTGSWQLAPVGGRGAR